MSNQRGQRATAVGHSLCRYISQTRMLTARLRRLTSVAALALLLLGTASALAHAQNGSFAGTVLNDATEKPLANAEVVFTALNRTVRSDSAGNFLFSGLPLGKHTVTVRLPGYESITTEVTLLTGKVFEADLMLKPITTKLATVETKATATVGPWAIKLQEFDARRATGNGRYLTLDYFETQGSRPLSAFLADKIPGVKIISSNGARLLASARGCTNKSCGQAKTGMGVALPKACYMKVVVNGILRYNGDVGQEMFDLDQLNSQDIIGLEFYTTATTPPQYNNTGSANLAPCGTLIVWTKGG